MFLKRKQSGKMERRGCVDWRPQQEYITKEESSPPTVSLYALIGSCVMDAMDGRKVITIDIPVAFGNWPQDKHPGYIELYCNWLLDCGQSGIHYVVFLRGHNCGGRWWSKNSRSYYPGNNQLFKVDDDSPRLLQKDSDIFHRHVTRLLFASKRTRPNI